MSIRIRKIMLPHGGFLLVPGMISRTIVRQLRSICSTQTLVGPAVRLLLYDYQLNPALITPSGPKGNLIKGDVLAYIKQSNLSPIKEELPLPFSNQEPLADAARAHQHDAVISKRRRRRNRVSFENIAVPSVTSGVSQRISQASATVPHNYTTVHVETANIHRFRKSLSLQSGLKCSVNDIIVKASANALKDVPEVNVRWVNNKAVPASDVDVSFSVITPAGMLTPIIFRADMQPLETISLLVRELAYKGKTNQLKPREFQGGSFTVSNLGIFGIHIFTAIINPPQTAILSVSAPHIRVDNEMNQRQEFSLTLCYDNRAIQENDAQRFLQKMQQCLNEPEASLMDGLGLRTEHNH